MWLTLLSVALAHPFESRLYGHQTTLWLTPDAATVEYAVEIPTASLLAEIRASLTGKPTQADQDAFNSRLHRDLRDSLRLVVNDERLDWTQAEPAEDSGRGDVKFIVYRLILKAPLPEGARTLKLIDGNFPDEPSIYQTSVLIDQGLILDASSQLDVEDGRLVTSRDGSWRPEEDSRELRLSFRRRGGARLWSALAGLGGQEAGLRPSSEVLSTLSIDPVGELRAGRLSPLSVLGVLGLSAMLGGLGGWRWPLLLIGAVGCGGLLVAGLSSLAVAGGIVLLLMGGAVAGARRIRGQTA
jgi:hypothetical protein